MKIALLGDPGPSAGVSAGSNGRSKNDETYETNCVRSFDAHQSVKSIHKNTLRSIAIEMLEFQSATLIPEGHFCKTTQLIMIFHGNCGLLSGPL